MCKHFWTLALLFISGFAQAKVLTWQDCLDMLIAQNPELKAAQSDVGAASYSEKAAYSGFLPQVNASLTYGRNGSESQSGVKAVQETHSASVSASQSIFSGFLDKNKTRQAKANKEKAEYVLSDTKARLSYELKSSFAQMQYAQARIALMEQIIKRRKDNLDMVNLRFQNGSENKGSLLLSQANLEQAKLNLLEAQNSLLSSQSSLAKILGVNEPESISVDGNIPLSSPQKDNFFSDIATKTPAYLQTVASENAAEAELGIARAGFFPTLGISLSKGTTDNRWFPQRDTWSVGATLTIPIFSGGSDFYKTKGAQEKYQSAALATENKGREQLNVLQQAYFAYVEAVKALEVDGIFVKAADARATIARQKYNNGLLTFENWDIIESDLISRQQALLTSQKKRVDTEATWERVRGGGVIP